jgi:hypothetical protein
MKMSIYDENVEEEYIGSLLNGLQNKGMLLKLSTEENLERC